MEVKRAWLHSHAFCHSSEHTATALRARGEGTAMGVRKTRSKSLHWHSRMTLGKQLHAFVACICRGKARAIGTIFSYRSMTHESIFLSRFLSSAPYVYVPLLPGHILWKCFRGNSNPFFFSKSRLISISSQTAKESLHRVPVLENRPVVQWCVRSLGSISEITFSPLTSSWFQVVAVSHQCYLPSLLSIALADTTAIFLSRPSMTCPLCSRRWDLRFNQLILKCASDVLFARFQTRHHHSSQLWSVKPLIAGGVVNSGP